MNKHAICLLLSLWCFSATNAFALNPMMLAAEAESAEKGQADESVTLPDNLSAADIDALMARLNDEQVRRLLIEELRAEAAVPEDEAENIGGLRGTIRGLESGTHLFISRAYRLIVSLPNVPGDLKMAMDSLTDFEGLGRLLEMTLIAFALLALGWVAEKVFMRLTAGLRERIETMPGMEGILRFWGAAINAIPELLGLLIFTITPLLVESIVVDRQDRNLRLLFLAFLLAIVAIRFGMFFLCLFFSPRMAKLRLLPLSCEVARYLHRRLFIIVSLTGASYVLLLLMSHLEVNRPAQIWLAIFLMTLIIGILANMVWSNRAAVKAHLLGKQPIACEKRAWLREQSASMWHILALAYLFLIWLLGFGQMVMADQLKFDGTFALSLMIVPIYLVLDRLAQWCVISVFAKKSDAPKAANPTAIEPSTEDKTEPPDAEEEREAPEAESKSYLDIASRVVRVVVFFAVALWFLDIWGFHITFGEEAVGGRGRRSDHAAAGPHRLGIHHLRHQSQTGRGWLCRR